MTRIERHVMSNQEAALVAEVVEAARACTRTWAAHGFTHNHIPDALTLHEAVRRLEWFGW